MHSHGQHAHQYYSTHINHYTGANESDDEELDSSRGLSEHKFVPAMRSTKSKVMASALAFCLIVLAVLAHQLKATLGAADECTRESHQHVAELHVVRTRLNSAKTMAMELSQKKGTLSKELESAETKFDHLNRVRGTLKSELEMLLTRCSSLQQEKLEISSQYELTRKEARQIEDQSRKLEALIGHLHDGLKVLDNTPTPGELDAASESASADGDAQASTAADPASVVDGASSGQASDAAGSASVSGGQQKQQQREDLYEAAAEEQARKKRSGWWHW